MPKQPPPSAIADKFMLRLPDGLRDTIAEHAKRAGRSMNAEVIYRLQMAYDQDAAMEDAYQLDARIGVNAMIRLLNRFMDELIEAGWKRPSPNRDAEPASSQEGERR